MNTVFAEKRLTAESNKHSWWAFDIQYFKSDNLIIVPIYNTFTTNYNYLSIKIKECYPFRPPDVIFNGKNVIRYYGELSNVLSTYKDFEKLTGQQCLCCSSILCSNNWSLNNHIIDIKNEFQKIYDLRYRISQRFWTKRIASRYLVEDIPLDDFL